MRRNNPTRSLSHKDTSAQPAASSAGASRTRTSEVVPAHLAKPVTDDDIRLRAYLKWEAEGRPEGHDLFFWCEAERELLGSI